MTLNQSEIYMHSHNHHTSNGYIQIQLNSMSEVRGIYAPWPYTFHFNSVTQLCLILCEPMDCSTPGFPAHHQLPELTQMYVHRVGDAIQPSHPPSSPSPPAFKLSQHYGLLKWVSSMHQVAKVLEFHLQHQSFQWIYSGLISFRIDILDLLAVQGTLKIFLQHHSSKASIFSTQRSL